MMGLERLILLGARLPMIATGTSVAMLGMPALARAQTQDTASGPTTATTNSTRGPDPASAGAAPVPSSETLPVHNKPLATSLPRRHEGRPLTWDPSFNRMDAPEMILTGVSAGVALAAAIIPPLKTSWRSGVWFDDATRNALRLPSYKARLDARNLSDIGLGFLTTFPILVDSMIVAYWYRGSDDVALQMALIDTEAIAVATALQGVANFFSGRERPYGRDCGGELNEQGIDCQGPSRNRSFFSGHATVSFASAALMCAHHQGLNLFDNAADPITCVSGFVAAAAVGMLRVVGDMHYLSDVITGAVIGSAVGLGIPLLHHYRKGVWWLGRAPGLDRASASFELQIVPAPNGAQFVGAF